MVEGGRRGRGEEKGREKRTRRGREGGGGGMDGENTFHVTTYFSFHLTLRSLSNDNQSELAA